MRLRLQKFSYRFAEQVLNSNIKIKNEIEDIILGLNEELSQLNRKHFNQLLLGQFISKGWESQPAVFRDEDEPSAKMDFLKERVGVEVSFTHSSFIGIDLLKFQVASYSALDKIDVGVYIVTTKSFQNKMRHEYGVNWKGSVTFEKAMAYLPHFKSAIQVPIYVLGIDL